MWFRGVAGGGLARESRIPPRVLWISGREKRIPGRGSSIARRKMRDSRQGPWISEREKPMSLWVPWISDREKRIPRPGLWIFGLERRVPWRVVRISAWGRSVTRWVLRISRSGRACGKTPGMAHRWRAALWAILLFAGAGCGGEETPESRSSGGEDAGGDAGPDGQSGAEGGVGTGDGGGQLCSLTQGPVSQCGPSVIVCRGEEPLCSNEQDGIPGTPWPWACCAVNLPAGQQSCTYGGVGPPCQ